jgi:hypothetical protein
VMQIIGAIAKIPCASDPPRPALSDRFQATLSMTSFMTSNLTKSERAPYSSNSEALRTWASISA